PRRRRTPPRASRVCHARPPRPSTWPRPPPSRASPASRPSSPACLGQCPTARAQSPPRDRPSGPGRWSLCQAPAVSFRPPMYVGYLGYEVHYFGVVLLGEYGHRPIGRSFCLVILGPCNLVLLAILHYYSAASHLHSFQLGP